VSRSVHDTRAARFPGSSSTGVKVVHDFQPPDLASMRSAASAPKLPALSTASHADSPASGRRSAVQSPQNPMYRITARKGYKRTAIAIATSNAPTSGMSNIAVSLWIPTTAK